MSDKSVQAPVEDTPADLPGPDNGTPGTEVNWQERYEHLQPEYTRASQEAAEYRRNAAEKEHAAWKRRMAEVIEKGAFLPADPGSWRCSEKFCEYWDDCPFGRARRQSFAMDNPW